MSRKLDVQNRRGTMHFTGDRFLLEFAIPHFYFHLTNAYAILRHRGIELTMADFLGRIGCPCSREPFFRHHFYSSASAAIGCEEPNAPYRPDAGLKSAADGGSTNRTEPEAPAEVAASCGSTEPPPVVMSTRSVSTPVRAAQVPRLHACVALYKPFALDYEPGALMIAHAFLHLSVRDRHVLERNGRLAHVVVVDPGDARASESRFLSAFSVYLQAYALRVLPPATWVRTWPRGLLTRRLPDVRRKPSRVLCWRPRRLRRDLRSRARATLALRVSWTSSQHSTRKAQLMSKCPPLDALAALTSRLRGVHLRAHIQMKAVLSPQQVAR